MDWSLVPIISNSICDVLSKKQNITNQEYSIMILKNMLETKIQQHCKIIFNSIELNHKNFDMDFMQIDNGGNQTLAGRKRKKCEGTIKGASDVMVFISNKQTKLKKFILFEFKRVGAFKIKNEQIAFQKRWIVCYGFDAYITNNPLFFEKTILNVLSSLIK